MTIRYSITKGTDDLMLVLCFMLADLGLKLDDGRLGMLGFNNMVPVHNDALIEFDIDMEPDKKYRELLRNQAVVCNRMKADIYDRASRTYFDVVNNKGSVTFSV